MLVIVVENIQLDYALSIDIKVNCNSGHIIMGNNILDLLVEGIIDYLKKHGAVMVMVKLLFIHHDCVRIQANMS